MRSSWLAFCRAAGAGLALVAVLFTSGCAWLDARQREVIYRPTPGVPANFSGLPAGAEAWSVTVTEPQATRLIGGDWLPANAPQSVRMWWLPHANREAPSLLYLHGTFRNLYQNLNKIEALRAAGFSVMAVDYRGWGSSTPITPSEASIKADARLAFAEFVKREARPQRRVIYGHSMGGGVAVALASDLQYPADHAALVLEATFASMPDVARRQGFWGRVGAAITTQIFDSSALIGRLQTPLLMLHGDADQTVPFGSGQALFDAARMPDKRFVTIPGGRHSSLQTDQADLYRRSFAELISRLPAP
jgi:uncharacterized protein